MKITYDENGKAIIDFEGLEIHVEDSFNLTAMSDLFHPDNVAEVNNGVWIGNQEGGGISLTGKDSNRMSTEIKTNK